MRLSVAMLVICVASPLSGWSQDKGGSTAPQPPAAVAQCTACHGNLGEGNATMNAPRIAGQSTEYLRRQLDSYASGARRNAVMEPIAKGMNPDQRSAAGDYFSHLNTAAGATASNPPANSTTAPKPANNPPAD